MGIRPLILEQKKSYFAKVWPFDSAENEKFCGSLEKICDSSRKSFNRGDI